MRHLLLLVVLLFISCAKVEPPERGDRRVPSRDKEHAVLKVSNEGRELTISSKEYYLDIDGIIFDVEERPGCTGRYYWYIKLDNGKVRKWEVSDVKFKSKGKGDRVHFDYIYKSYCE